MEPRLTDGTILLAKFTFDDLPQHLAAEDEEHARRFGWWPARSTEESAQAAFRQWDADWRTGGDTRTFAVRLVTNVELVGGCELRLREHEIVQLSYWIFPEHRRRGLATRAVRLVCVFAFDELSAERVEAFVEPDNAASLGVLRRAGFVAEGIARSRERVGAERKDMVLWSRLPSDA